MAMKSGQIPKAIANAFTSARHVVVLTGAGVSSESGVDTFRGADGLWNKVNIEEVATPQGFARDSVKVWKWYDMRRTKLKEIRPNPAHYALARMEEHFEHFVLVTQNVDGLHAIAGSKDIVELHGNIWNVIDVETGEVTENFEAPLEKIPPSNDAGNMIRPGVVWFGEMLPPGVLERSFAEAEKCDLCLVVGTSAFVQPAASIPLIAKRAGATVLEFTLQETELTHLVDHSFLGKAGETLPPFLELIGKELDMPS